MFSNGNIRFLIDFFVFSIFHPVLLKNFFLHLRTKIIIIQRKGIRNISILIVKIIGADTALNIDFFYINPKFRGSIESWYCFTLLLNIIHDKYVCFETANKSILRMANKYLILENLWNIKNNNVLVKDLDFNNNNIALFFNKNKNIYKIIFLENPPVENFYFTIGRINKNMLSESLILPKIIEKANKNHHYLVSNIKKKE